MKTLNIRSALVVLFTVLSSTAHADVQPSVSKTYQIWDNAAQLISQVLNGSDLKFNISEGSCTTAFSSSAGSIKRCWQQGPNLDQYTVIFTGADGKTEDLSAIPGFYESLNVATFLSSAEVNKSDASVVISGKNTYMPSSIDCGMHGFWFLKSFSCIFKYRN